MLNLTLDCKAVDTTATKNKDTPIRLDIEGIDLRDIRDNAEELLDVIGQDAAERYFAKT